MEVAIKGCKSYDLERVMEALEEGLEELGGVEGFCKKGERVLLKVNLLLGKDPNKSVTTHPVVVEAVARIFQKAGAAVIIGDSPGGPFIPGRLKRIYEVTGLRAVAERTGAALNYECGSHQHMFQEGKIINQVLLGDYLKEAHQIINLPKLKTHSFTGMTAGVKNLFGAVPGLEKVDYHLRFQDVETFSHVLVDIALAIQPALTILDGITSMEGAGPSWGDPRDTSFLVLSQSPFLLDLAASRLLGFDDSFVVTNRCILERGLAPEWEDIQQRIPISDYEVLGFKEPSSINNMNEGSFFKRLPFHLGPAFVEYIRPRPRFKHDFCKGCGDCQESCPPGAITMVDRRPVLNQKECIRCFCCQELCPYGAVEIKRNLLGRILSKS